MHYESPFACVATDSGLVSEILPVSPVFVRCGPPTRGVFGDRRLARTRRSDVRLERNVFGRRSRAEADFFRSFGET